MSTPIPNVGSNNAALVAEIGHLIEDSRQWGALADKDDA